MKSKILWVLALLASVQVGLVQDSFAELCKSPKIVIYNDDPDQSVKVEAVDYYDGCEKKWRTEDLSTKKIAPGDKASFTDNLEYVEGCPVNKFKIKRSKHTMGTSLSDKAWEDAVYSGEKLPDETEGGKKSVDCVKGQTFTLHITD